MEHHEYIDSAVPLPQGLKAWMQGQGPEVWHSFARSVRFGAPMATIDLLLAADWISRQPNCDRATAFLLLARAQEAGLLERAPVAMDNDAARAFCLDLRRRLALWLSPAQFGLTQTEARLVGQHCADLLKSCPVRAKTAPRASFAFAGNRPQRPAMALHIAA